MSDRVRETLKIVDLVLCEDTRVTSKLLARADIAVPLKSFHQHTDAKEFQKVINLLLEGKNIAFVTDAGTPAISDPGGKLVEEVVRALGQTVRISPIPGPSAVTAALSVSGFPADEFLFLGFVPQKKGRHAFFERIRDSKSTVVFYESTHRIVKAIAEIADVMPGRQIVVCRELTKMYETIYRGAAREVTDALNSSSIKGEFVIVIRAL